MSHENAAGFNCNFASVNYTFPHPAFALESVRAMSAQRNVLLALGSYDHRIHRGVARFAGEHHWHLNSEMCRSGRLPRGWSGEGILTALDVQPDLVRFVRAATVPIVDLSLNRQDIPLPRVVGDHRRIGRQAAEHFLERGFRHFAWHANDARAVAELRRRGFADTLARAGLACEAWIWRPGGRRPSDQWRAKSRWLAQRLQALPKPAAVFAFRDADAANVLDACLEGGLAVPEEIAILGVDDNELVCESVRIPLSSVQHDLEGLGYHGAALLDRLMRGQPAPAQPELIPPKGITARRSTDVLAVHHEPSRRALGFLRENYSRNVGVADVAQSSGLARRRLEQAFRQQVGRTIHQELARVRLAKVKELLLETKLPVAEIARRTGFTTPQYLNLVFRKATGLPPRRFRVAAGGTGIGAAATAARNGGG